MATFTETEIGDIVDRVRSWSPATDSNNAEFTYIDLSSVDKDSKSIVNPVRTPCADAPSRARQLVAYRDVLVSTVRPNLNGVAAVPPELDGATASTGFCVLRPRQEKVCWRYLYHWVRSPGFIRDMTRMATGASYPAVSDRIIHESKIPLPTLEEQKRIAAILDKADAIRRKRQEAISGSRALAVSAIEYELGLLIAKDLKTRSLESVCDKVTDGTHLTPTFRTDGIPFIFVKNIENQRINFETSKFIDAPTYERLTKSTKIEVGDVLYTTVGATYGQAALVETNERFAFQRHLAHLKPNKKVVIPAYLAAVMNLPRTKWQADRWARGAAQPTINLTELRQMVVPVPTLEDQEEIASIRRKCDLLLENLEVAFRLDDHLFNSLVQRAFKGEL